MIDSAESNGMRSTPAITCLFLEIGRVLLTDGWARGSRKLAVAHFKLNAEEIEDRHLINWNTYQEGKLTLDEYLTRVIFFQRRSTG
jgi:putative hydrolase of the HAD superfamily